MTSHRERADRVEEFTEQRVRSLLNGYRGNHSKEVAELAKLRRGVGRRVDADIELLGIALAGPDVDIVDPSQWAEDDPLPEERAAFTAITLFALHQQSRRDASMHHRGYSIGRSTRLLARKVDRDSVRQRFTALGTATTWDETVQHARGLIQQLRQHTIPLDYGRFARDLFDLHVGSGDRVRMTWGRDFYRLHHPEDDSDASTETSTD
ncbi:type I-E CRISPR-associated protein Cse2/CasB [Microbacterium halotolerans]|uniref:type I-E CRISPR-associated protein Cse2/CasB n=1 Tax=Microbacterium halotolerans TaxID=246613 RepID=UPI0013C2F00A|nr:type I-E CRISPR-associated protein Cse2/CasB [Microbacterium halotolerans]